MKLTLEYNKVRSVSGISFPADRWVIEDSAILEALDMWLGDESADDNTISIVELLVGEIKERVSNSQMKLGDEESLSILRAGLDFADELSLDELHSRLNQLLAHCSLRDGDNSIKEV